MKKTLAIIGLLNLAFASYGQVYKGQMDFSKVPVPPAHYNEEYHFDTTVNSAAWASLGRGMHVAFGSTDQLYFRSEVPELANASQSFQATAWKGERVNSQLLVWSADTLKQVRLVVNDLKNRNGQTISKNNFQVHMVRYVVGNYPYGAKDVTCGASPYKDLYLMPDRFESFDRFELPGKSTRPVWVSIDIPAGTAPGVYTGTVDVKSENYTSTVNFSVNVQGQLLPKPAEWKHRLDLWQNPWVVAWKNNVEPWSAEHKQLLKKHLKLYADAGGKFITTYAVHSPWADNSYMIEGSMIEWTKKTNGSWKFDYNIFDEYVQMAMDLGIDKAITIYTPVPWGFRFRYMDEKSGNYVYVAWSPESKEFKSFWNIFLTDLKKHLEQKGWFEKTYIGINENEMEQTLAAIKVVKGHSPKWKITYAGDYHKELETLLDDYCFLYGKESNVDVVNQRAKRGQTTTYYVCCNPPVPNNFVFSPPIEGRWISWYTTAHNYDGFLRWAYDAWPNDPMRDARHELWPAGDCYLVYPGGNSCIRFEKLREGIVDFEKIRILKEKAALSKDPAVKTLLARLNEHMQVFLAEKDFDSKKITADVEKGRDLVNQLSDRLVSKPL